MQRTAPDWAVLFLRTVGDNQDNKILFACPLSVEVKSGRLGGHGPPSARKMAICTKASGDYTSLDHAV